ncbi:MAG TPA: DUF805 domain-containing protein [Gammaproteobacteria bacterium]|nr:DUF805 domain-containing protein [Gammaproteobacteria bacterium]
MSEATMSDAKMNEPNPYSTPGADLGNAQDSLYQPKIFSFSGRIGRMRYLAYGFGLSLLMNVAMIPFIGATALMGGMAGDPGSMGMLSIVLLAVIGIVSLVFAVMWLKRRFNDLNRSGWWMLLFFIPVVNLIVGIYLLFFPGTDGPNNFGPAPAANSIGVLILGWLAIAAIVLGIVGAIAAPMMMMNAVPQ